jgi:hypothetical protein
MTTAGLIARSPQGRVLILCRYGHGWSWPSREERGPRIGESTLRQIDGGAALYEVSDEFAPAIDHEHGGWCWATPEAALALAGAEEEESKAPKPQIEAAPEPEIDPTLADGVEALARRMALLDVLERLNRRP